MDRVVADKAAMLALPPIPPVTGRHESVRLPRDHYVRVDGNDYSVHPSVIGQRIHVDVDLTRVKATCGGKVVADHDRSWAKHQTFTDPAHAAAAVALRRSRFAPTPPSPAQDVEQRDLSVYDRITDGQVG